MYVSMLICMCINHILHEREREEEEEKKKTLDQEPRNCA